MTPQRIAFPTAQDDDRQHHAWRDSIDDDAEDGAVAHAMPYPLRRASDYPFAQAAAARLEHVAASNCRAQARQRAVRRLLIAAFVAVGACVLATQLLRSLA